MSDLNTDVAIIIPTLGRRKSYLEECLASIEDAGGAFIVMISPDPTSFEDYLNRYKVDLNLPDPNKGLAAAINFAVSSLPAHIKYFNWLGDDDLLTGNSISLIRLKLAERPEAIAAYGKTIFIDARGEFIAKMRLERFAKLLMHFGPNKFPQPGALFSREAFEAVGQLDESYGWAFDFDLFLRLSKIGPIVFVPQTVSKFRWHASSLSAGQSSSSIRESSRARRNSLPRLLAVMSFLWEVPHTLLAVRLPNRLNGKEQE